MSEPDWARVKEMLGEPVERLSPCQQLRIEALRAAAITCAPTLAVIAKESLLADDPTKHFNDDTMANSVKSMAEVYLAWLSETPPHE